VTVTKSGRVVRRFSVAVGRPGTPTPPGRYAVTDKLELMSRSAAYGCCALALSGHQPRVAQGWAGGDRLAIHGTSEPQTIGRAASLGCLRARDGDARWVVQHVFLGTIVEIRR
jgi:lipoprotein-anchoring transpeptidase ErfK/SrfK